MFEQDKTYFGDEMSFKNVPPQNTGQKKLSRKELERMAALYQLQSIYQIEMLKFAVNYINERALPEDQKEFNEAMLKHSQMLLDKQNAEITEESPEIFTGEQEIFTG